MDTGRVGACNRQKNKRRKFLIVINDVVKNKYDVYAEYLDHAHEETEHRFEKSKFFVRRSLVRQKVLQQCMKMRRQTVNRHSVYGKYGGKPIESFGRDIESFIGFNHPKMRRQRQLQKLMNESLEKGAILKQNIATDRIANWMERSYTKYKLQLAKCEKEKTVLEPIPEKETRSRLRRDDRDRLPRLPMAGKAFYTGASLDTDTQPRNHGNSQNDPDVLKLADGVKKVDINDNFSKDEDADYQRSIQRAMLKVPPINPTKGMVKAS